MAHAKTTYQCITCQAVYPKWIGKCDGCGAWNSIEMLQGSAESQKARKASQGQVLGLTTLSAQESLPALRRLASGMQEFDRTLGGGLVPGSFVLVGGDPGIGKSTLLSQVVALLSKDHACCYVSAEEDIAQIRMRAQRLGLEQKPLHLLAANHMEDILTTLRQIPALKVVVIDSIQTVYSGSMDSAPGTLTQVRNNAQELMHLAKSKNICVMIVSHVTKEGVIAGPKTLEHMVDTVLYFEGERGHAYRMLRAIKNRFGPTDEMGVFVMEENGLAEVQNPSALFLSQRPQSVPGTAVYAGVEGTRPLLVEIQALLSPANTMPPRRHVVGWDAQRLGMMMAILETHGGLPLGQRDVYLNIVGGLKLSDPGVDLAVCAAILSCFFQTPLPDDALFFGEVGLVGEVRPVGHRQARLKEGMKLGFKQAFVPPCSSQTPPLSDMVYRKMTALHDLMQWFRSHRTKAQAPQS